MATPTVLADAADTSAADNARLLQTQRDHGHYFTKKTFRSPTVCHHCCETIWGLLSTGYLCEGDSPAVPSHCLTVCNFTCHVKCLQTVASYCSCVALELVKVCPPTVLTRGAESGGALLVGSWLGQGPSVQRVSTSV